MSDMASRLLERRRKAMSEISRREKIEAARADHERAMASVMAEYEKARREAKADYWRVWGLARDALHRRLAEIEEEGDE